MPMESLQLKIHNKQWLSRYTLDAFESPKFENLSAPMTIHSEMGLSAVDKF